MDDAALVDDVQGVEQGPDTGQRLGLGDGPPVEARLQALALDVLHLQAGAVLVVLEEVDHLDHAADLDGAQRLKLASKPLPLLPLRRQHGVQDLQGRSCRTPLPILDQPDHTGTTSTQTTDGRQRSHPRRLLNLGLSKQDLDRLAG